MFSYTVIVIDLIDPVDFPYCGQHGQHSQQPCADRSAGKISVTPPTNPKTLTDANDSRVPTLGCGWKNLIFDLKAVSSSKCFSVFCKNNSIVTINRLHKFIAFGQIRNCKHGLLTLFSSFPLMGQLLRAIRKPISATRTYINSNDNKKALHILQNTNSGSLVNICLTGYSCRRVFLATEFLKHLGYKASYFSSVRNKNVVMFTVI